jgi:hypothetical protein
VISLFLIQLLRSHPVISGVFFLVTSQTDTASVANTQFTLYVDTGIDIKQGDALTITHKAQTIKGVAGLPFKRNFSNVIKVESVVYA